MKKKPSVWVSILPLVFLLGMLSLVVSTFGSDSLMGASQTAMLLATALVITIGILVYGIKFEVFEQSIAQAVGAMGTPIIMLLLIGALSSTWMVSGIVPLLIDFGMKIINPTFFLPITCFITAIVSVLIGSSWTTIATIGLALESIGKMQGYEVGWIAGAIISGAYFGDKMSPLSDTTVLATSTAKVPIFTHIRYMVITTIPSLTIAFIVFLLAGLLSDNIGGTTVTQTDNIQILRQTFNLSPWLLLVPMLTALMIWKRLPSNVVLFAGVLLGLMAEMFFQPHLVHEIAGEDGILGVVRGLLQSVSGSTSIATGNASVDALVATRGMAGMLNTIWLIICAVTFGASLQAAGMLESITASLVKMARGVCGLVSSTVFSAFLLNVLTADQYTSILLSGQMFGEAYKQKGLENRLLSRCLEDGGTVTSVLVPWNTCGMTQSTVLGVSTLTYLPYCVFNYVSPLMSIFISAIGYKIYKRKE